MKILIMLQKEFQKEKDIQYQNQIKKKVKTKHMVIKVLNYILNLKKF